MKPEEIVEGGVYEMDGDTDEPWTVHIVERRGLRVTLGATQGTINVGAVAHRATRRLDTPQDGKDAS